MKPLRFLFDAIGPAFEKGGKLHKLYPIYEVIDTFFYTPPDVTKDDCHVRDGMDYKRMMSVVLVALLPCVLMAMYNVGLQANKALAELGVEQAAGWRGAVMQFVHIGLNPYNPLDCVVHGALYFLPVYIVCMVTGIAIELLFCCVRNHELSEGFFVTGLLLPLTLPPTIPLWQVVMGTAFGVVVAKEIFGGTGRNFLNPALAGRAYLFFAYPAQISGDAVWTAADGFTGATPLGAAAVDGMAGVTSQVSWLDAFVGTMQGSMGETSALACLVGAVILVAAGIGSWRIMVSMLAGAMAFATMLWMVGSETNPVFEIPPHWHLVLGGFAFGLVFMATDPISAAMTRVGQYIYGVFIGVVVIMVRVINPAYPEGVMLAILLGNCVAPLIDYYVLQANISRRKLRYV